jgi:hypothetical protein
MMKKIYLLLLINFLAINIFAQKPTANVTYSKGTFTTTVSMTLNASHNAVNKLVDDFISQYKSNLPALFEWALQGVNLHGEKDKFMIFNVKQHTLANGVVRGKMDMTLVPLGQNFTDVPYNVVLKKTKNTANEIELSYQLTDCKEVIKQASATMKIVHTNDHTATVTLVADVQLTRFYNTLVSKKMYAENMQWRFVNFVENLVKASEK